MNRELYSIVSPCGNMMLYNNTSDDESDDYKMKNHYKKKINMILSLLITTIAVYLAWKCNKHESMGLRVLYSLFAGLFSGIYLLYYLVVRVFLNNKCGTKFKLQNYYSATSPEFENLFKRRN
jgi:Na+/H+ antiporter NhaC